MFYFKYICAQCYDAFIVCTLFFVYTALCMLIRHGATIPPYTLWYQLSLLMIFFLYYSLSVRYGGQTMGMRSWGFWLVTCDKTYLSISQAAVRLILYFPALLLSIVFLKPPSSLLRHWSNTTLIIKVH